jgi:hypothetical protein
MSARTKWVAAKAQAAKENGGKDVWKDHKVPNQNLGPALDAFDAAAAKFKALDKKFDEDKTTKQQKEQWIALALEKNRTGKRVNELARNYMLDLERIVSHGATTKKIEDVLSSGLKDASRHVTPERGDKEQLQRRIDRLKVGTKYEHDV